MTPPIQQAQRRLKVKTPLGSDVMLLRAVRGREEMSRPFVFELDLLSEDENVDPAKIIGEAVSFSVENEGGAPRHFHGIVSRFAAGEVDGGLRQYRATVVPHLWLLTKGADCRIFQEKGLQDILEEVLGDHGVPSDSFRIELKKAPPPYPYCVQYGETAFNFLSRLMEREGVFYFFEFKEDSHCMVISDDTSSYSPCPDNKFIHTKGSRPGSHLHSWEHRYEILSGSWANQDYNYETPSSSLLGEEPVQNDCSSVKHGVYEFPGEFLDQDQADARARVRIEEEEATCDLVEALGSYTGVVTGGTFKVSEHDCEAEVGKEYVITSVQHTAIEGSYGGGASSGESYKAAIVCMPASRTFRPQRTAPKPVINGPQTAIVVGPSGEEIYTDEYGRVCVQFRWDRVGKNDENSSCWIRVAQNWAGNQWGAHFLPRIGQEVVVAFMDGDPDRPLVTAGVYNPEQMPPHTLPDNKTQGLIKTRSSKGGGAENFNMIRFEDKKGSEELYFHAEKDQKQEVENDQTLHVGNNRDEAVDQDRSLTVGGNKSETVEGDKSVSVEGNHDETVTKDMTLTVDAGRSMTIAKDLSEDVSGNMALSVKKDRDMSVDGKLREKVAKDVTVDIKGQKSQDVAKNYSLKAKKVSIEAADEILIKSGKAKILLKKNGDILINGKKIMAKGSGDIVLKGTKVTSN